LMGTLVDVPRGTLFAMDTGGSANHWGPRIRKLGLRVRLISAQHVRAVAREDRQNDAVDALAICEATFRPGIRWVKVKTLEQQDLKVLRCARQRGVTQRTALANHIRGVSPNTVRFSQKNLRVFVAN